jgi:DNA invertase Pin-like site-specific DNA recombinase
MSNVVLYRRVSTCNQQSSWHCQEVELRKWATEEGHTVVDLIGDYAVSAYRIPIYKRKGGKQAITLCLQGDADFVVCTWLDRWTRYLTEDALFIKACRPLKGLELEKKFKVSMQQLIAKYI